MGYRLPPLNSLRLFEAAGRHLSFKLAAEELHITPSAVSHGIQVLEEWLGVPLFARGHRLLALTAAGQAYLPHVRVALETLAKASEAVPGRRPCGRLSVSVAPSFGLRWLIPNLPDFGARHPDIEVSLDTSHRLLQFPRDGVDLAIRMGKGDWPDLYAICLVQERLVPVCAPSLAARLQSAVDLRDVPLLHVMNISDDWQGWARITGVEGLDLSAGLRFDTVQMSIEAAIQGLGVAIGRLPLVDADIAAGRLVPVLFDPVPCETGYWLVTNRESLIRPEVAAFRDWIRSALKGQGMLPEARIA